MTEQGMSRRTFFERFLGGLAAGFAGNLPGAKEMAGLVPSHTRGQEDEGSEILKSRSEDDEELVVPEHVEVSADNDEETLRELSREAISPPFLLTFTIDQLPFAREGSIIFKVLFTNFTDAQEVGEMAHTEYPIESLSILMSQDNVSTEISDLSADASYAVPAATSVRPNTSLPFELQITRFVDPDHEDYEAEVRYALVFQQRLSANRTDVFFIIPLSISENDQWYTPESVRLEVGARSVSNERVSAEISDMTLSSLS